MGAYWLGAKTRIRHVLGCAFNAFWGMCGTNTHITSNISQYKNVCICALPLMIVSILPPNFCFICHPEFWEICVLMAPKYILHPTSHSSRISVCVLYHWWLYQFFLLVIVSFVAHTLPSVWQLPLSHPYILIEADDIGLEGITWHCCIEAGIIQHTWQTGKYYIVFNKMVFIYIEIFL